MRTEGSSLGISAHSVSIGSGSARSSAWFPMIVLGLGCGAFAALQDSTLPFWAVLLGAGFGCAAAVMVRPFVLLCAVAAFFALDAFVQIQQGDVYALTVTKLVALPLFLSLARVAVLYPARLKPDPGLVAGMAFLIWNCVSWYAAENWNRALRNTLTFVQLGMLVCGVRLLLTSLGHLRRFSMVMVVSLSISAVFALAQYYRNGGGPVSGTSQNAALMSADLFVASAFAIALAATAAASGERLTWILFASMNIVALAVSQARAAYLCFLPVLFVGMFFYGRLQRFVLVAVLSAALVVPFLPGILNRMSATNLRDASTMGHAISIVSGIRMTLDKPILGVGSGNYVEEYLQYSNDPRRVPRTAHNSYLAVASETGLPGLGFFLAIQAVAFAVLLRTRARCIQAGDSAGLAFVAAAAASLSAFALVGCFHSLHLTKYLWVLIGLGLTQPAFSSSAWRGARPEAECAADHVETP